MGNTKIKDIIILSLILFAGLLVRLIHINFPAIGYHNMKENDYISMAKYMESSGDLISRKVYFQNAFEEGVQKEFNLFPQVPFVAYQILLGYKFFGHELWFPRLINILMILGSIVVMYFLTFYLTGDSSYGLMSAMLLGFLPLSVFFSRNLQPESGAFFFTMLGTLFFFRFLENKRFKYLIFISWCFAIVAAYKLSFLICFLPLVIITPYRKLFHQKSFSDVFRMIAVFLIPVIILVGWWLLTNQINFKPSVEGRVNLIEIFTVTYWKKNGPAIWRYATHDNFTTVFFVIFVTGILLSWGRYRKDKTLLAQYLRMGSLCLILYFSFFSDYVNQHNYYQMPFLGFFCLSVIYTITICIKKFLFNLNIKWQRTIASVIFLSIFILSYPQIVQGIRACYSTIFWGQDVVGEYIRESTPDNEKIFIYTFAQGYATCVYAERDCGYENNLDEFQRLEDKWNMRYIVIYPYYFLNTLGNNMVSYVKDNYHIKLIGFLKIDDNFIPQILLLEKGGKLDIVDFIEKQKSKVKIAKIYNTINGKVPFYIIE